MGADPDAGGELPLRLQPSPSKELGKLPAFARAYREVLPPSHREALREAAIVYLDECYTALRETPLGASYAETAIGRYLPRRYQHYYDGRFARDWAAVVTVVGWKLAQTGRVKLACVAEELALNALIGEAAATLDLSEESEQGAWDDFRSVAFEDEDYRYLFDPAFDGIEDDAQAAAQFSFVGLSFPEWFKPFNPRETGVPHPLCTSQ